MLRRAPRSTRTDTRVPDTTLFRSVRRSDAPAGPVTAIVHSPVHSIDHGLRARSRQNVILGAAMSEISESQSAFADEKALTERQRSVLERIDRRMPIK